MILLKLSYLGTAYNGFQVQPNGITVQQRLQDAAEAVFGKRYPVTGCSRTDSGVHANEFYCTIGVPEISLNVKLTSVPSAMNARLPKDISVSECFSVDENFHPRYNALYKEYLYLILNRRQRDPFLNYRAYHYPRALNIPLMNEAAARFVGRFDFASFTASGSGAADTVRNILHFRAEQNEGLVSVKIAGDGFLYNMVRILTGTLIYVSEGKINAEHIEEIILSRDRKKAGPTLPPHGLYLNKVVYGEFQ